MFEGEEMVVEWPRATIHDPLFIRLNSKRYNKDIVPNILKMNGFANPPDLIHSSFDNILPNGLVRYDFTYYASSFLYLFFL